MTTGHRFLAPRIPLAYITRLGACVLLTAAAGCAQWQSQLVPPAVAPERASRRADAVKAFEQHRDFAQLEAALDQWKSGNPDKCESMLAALLERRPDFIEARLRLGELLVSRADYAAAEGHLRSALQAEPNRAETHHALGLMLEAAGRRREAETHLAKAAELDPQNDIYRATAESVSSKARR